MTKQTQSLSLTESDIRIDWDSKPIRQQFGDMNIVMDGVATLPDGRSFRLNTSANRAGRRIETTLRYMTEAKRGNAVPESQMGIVRSAAQQSALPVFAAFVLEERAQLPRREAEAARRRGTSANPDKPFTGYVRTPVSAFNFDFATLEEAREYLADQIARAEGIAAGRAPAGPRYVDPFGTFIVWAGGVETLADSPWNYRPGEPGAEWIKAEPVADMESADGFRFLVFVDESGQAGLCEGGVYHPRAAALSGGGDYSRNNLEAAEREAAALNSRTSGSPYQVRDSLEGVATTDGDVLSSLAPWQKAALPPVQVETVSDIESTGSLGDIKVVGTIDLTPTWAGILPLLLAGVTDGTDTGRRIAKEELARMAALADERNAMAPALLALATVANETAHCIPAGMAREEMESATAAAFALLNSEAAADPFRDVNAVQVYRLKGDGCQAPGAIVLRHLPDNDCTPYVVHFRNDQDSERTGRPCYYFGDYCRTLADGWRAFADKVARYDPTGELAR